MRPAVLTGVKGAADVRIVRIGRDPSDGRSRAAAHDERGTRIAAVTESVSSLLYDGDMRQTTDELLVVDCVERGADAVKALVLEFR
jgi:hypothetical protein